MVENVEPPTPAKKRTTSMPAYERVSPVQSWHMTKSMPDAMKTGRLPFISEKGARTMGAMAKPRMGSAKVMIYVSQKEDTYHR